MLVSQINPVGIHLISYVNNFFSSNKFAWLLATWVQTLCQTLPMQCLSKQHYLLSGKKINNNQTDLIQKGLILVLPAWLKLHYYNCTFCLWASWLTAKTITSIISIISINQSINQLINQSINHLNQSINQSINHFTTRKNEMIFKVCW